jgi:hypothetical protein
MGSIAMVSSSILGLKKTANSYEAGADYYHMSGFGRRLDIDCDKYQPRSQKDLQPGKGA